MDKVLASLIFLALGSFANTVISFYTEKSSFDLKRSICQCGKQKLSMYEMIPLLSYLLYHGRCSKCNKKLSLRYFIVELTFLITGIVAYEKYDLSLVFVLSFIPFGLLIIIAVVDYYRFIIPNILTLIIFSFAVVKLIFLSSNIIGNIIVSILVVLLFILANYLSCKIKGYEVIGFGDIKLLLSLALMTEVPLNLIALWISALLAIPGFYLLRLTVSSFREEKRVPFGMFIAIGFILVTIMDEKIYRYYFSWLGI